MQAYFFGMVRSQNVAVSPFFSDQTDHFSDIPKCLVQRLSLAVAAFKERAPYHVESVLIFFDENGHLPVPLFSPERHSYLPHV